MDNYPYYKNNQLRSAMSDLTISFFKGRDEKWKKQSYQLGHINYTIYRSGKHNAWTRTFSNNNMWQWLFCNEGLYKQSWIVSKIISD